MKMGEEVKTNSQMVWKFGIVIDQDNCDVCEACVFACLKGVLAVVDGRIAVVNNKNCNRCGACVKACPYRSISV